MESNPHLHGLTTTNNYSPLSLLFCFELFPWKDLGFGLFHKFSIFYHEKMKRSLDLALVWIKPWAKPGKLTQVSMFFFTSTSSTLILSGKVLGGSHFFTQNMCEIPSIGWKLASSYWLRVSTEIFI